MINIHNNETIKVSYLSALKECGTKKYSLKKLNLLDKDYLKLSFLKNGCNVITNALQNKLDVYAAINEYVKGIDKSWYNMQLQYEVECKRMHDILFRIASYLCDYMKGKSSQCKVTYTIDIGNSMYRGVKFSKINGLLDFILEDESTVEGICFKTGTPVESYRAKKAENLPQNNIQIACMYAALKQQFSNTKKIKASLYYLKSKDDKNGVLAPFESKAGKNIISVTYSDEAPLSEITRAANFFKNGECDKCRLKDVCSFDSCVNMADKIDVSTNITPTKNIMFSEAQQKVIAHRTGAMLVEAVPGAGKTASVVQRTVDMINEGINPNNILVISFTDKAVDELKQRILTYIGDKEKMPVIKTFNSLGYEIIRENPDIFGHARLACDIDEKRLIAIALQNTYNSNIVIKNVNYSALYGDYCLIDMLYDLFKKLDAYGTEWFCESYGTKKDVNNIISVYETYLQLFAQNHYITYDDQIKLVADMFKSHPDICRQYQKIYKYISVDEFQDICKEQFDMVYSLAGHGNILCVGDSDQAIYGFRGGTVEYALNFDKYFNNAQIIFMQDNYRCGSKIVLAANTLIKNNTNRYDKLIIPHKSGNIPFLYKDLPADGILRLIDNLSTEYDLEDIAVISRKNSLLDKFSMLLNGDYSGKTYLVDDAMFMSVFDVLTLYFTGLDNDKALYRLLIRCGANQDDILKENRHNSLYVELTANKLIPVLRASDGYIPQFSNKSLWNAGVKIANCLSAITFSDFNNIFENIALQLFSLNYHPVIDLIKDRFQNQLISSTYDAYLYMKDMLIFKDRKRISYDTKSHGINFLTAHDSKGKEFKCVIIYGIDEFEPTEEERRLLYVAMTRAKETLVIIQNSISDNMLHEVSDCVKHLKMKEAKGGI